MAKIQDVINRNVITVNPEQSIEEIAKILTKNNLSGVPVIDKKGRLIGYLSERDMIRSIPDGGFATKKAKDIMTKKVISVEENASFESISQIFTEYPVRNIPVTKKGKIVGVISRKDIIQKLMGNYY